MKRNVKGILLFALALMVLVLCPTATSAKAKLKLLKVGKTYRYDVNHDGKKDKIRLKQKKTYNEDGETRIDIYINGTRKIKAIGMKGCEVLVFTKGKKSILIGNYIYGDSGNGYGMYYPKKNKYKAQMLGESLFFTEAKASGNNLKIYTEPKGCWWFNSFSNYFEEVPFRIVTTYKFSSGKLKKTSKYPGVTGQKTYTAVNSFTTGKSISSVSSGDGPYVTAGSTVTLKKFANTTNGYFYQITVGGKTGWFQDSEYRQLR